MNKIEIKIALNRGDVDEWLNPEGDQDAELVDRWADQYAEALAAGIAKLHPQAVVSVDWGAPMSYKISVAVPDWPLRLIVDYQLRAELALDYEAVCGDLAEMHWMDPQP